MYCLSTLPVNFRNISSFITSSTNYNNCLKLSPKIYLSCCVTREQTLFNDDIRSLERSTISAIGKCSNQSSEINALITYYKMKR